MLRYVFAFVSAAGLVFACSSDPETPVAPASTDAGAETSAPIDDGDAGVVSAGTLEAAVGDAGTSAFNAKLSAHYATESDRFNITGHSADEGTDNIQLYVHFPGIAKGTFACEDDKPAKIEYNAPGDETYATDPALAGTTCTVTVTSAGDVGEMVEGTFSATMRRVDLGEPTTLTTSGTFQVVRGEDND